MSASMDTSGSAAKINAGNDDILIEILLCVPTRSLIRFKSVCKHWFSLISSSHFSHLHTLSHRSTTASALCLRKPPFSHYLIPLQNRPPRFHNINFKLTPNSNYNNKPTATTYTTKILQSCNGLLLLQVYPNGQSSLKDYYVYNPAMHQSRFLQLNFSPQSSSSIRINRDQSLPRVLGVSLAYDPSKSAHYKVICVKFATFSSYCYEIEVHESETHTWKLANEGKEFVVPYDLKCCDGIYWNGYIHWIRPKGKSFYFDLDKECFVPCPGIPVQRRWWADGGRDTYYFGNSNRHLHFVAMYRSRSPKVELQDFEMENDCSRWFLKYQVNFNDIVCAFPEIRRTEISFKCSAEDYYAFCVLGMVRGEKDEESELVFHVPGRVVAYKLRMEVL